MQNEDVSKRSLETEEDDSIESSAMTKKARVMSEGMEVFPATMVVDMGGKDGVDTLVSITNPALKAEAERDLLVFSDMSGSMCNTIEYLKGALHHIASNAQHEHKKTQFNINIALGMYNSTSFIPGVDKLPDIPSEPEKGAFFFKPWITNDETEKLPYGYTPWMPLHQVGYATMMNFTNKFITKSKVGSTTNMLGMIKHGLQVLGERRKSYYSDNSSVLQHLLIMTDGRPDLDQTQSDIENAVKEGIGDCSVVVHILLLGNYVDLSLSEAISYGTTGGIVAYANKPDNLGEAFDSILKPIYQSSRAFTLQVEDKGGKLRVHHLGILSNLNNQALVKLDFGPKTQVGKNNLAAKILLLDSDNVSNIVMPYYAPDCHDAMFTTIHAKEPSELTEFKQSIIIEQKIKDEMMQKVRTHGLRHASDHGFTLIAQNTATLPAPFLHRLNAFAADVELTSKRSDASTMTPVARMASVTASYSQSRV